MKICLFSDLHAHPYSNGNILEHGTNSRVVDAINVINQVYDHANSISAEWVLFGGDLFDRRKSIDVDTYNKVQGTISGRSKDVSTVLLVGNHDQANRSGTIHALECFKSDTCHVADEPKWRHLGDDVGLYTVPYYDDGERIASYVSEGITNRPPWAKKGILLIHYGIYGAKVGPGDYIIPCELNLSMLSPDKWDIIFGGHYHIGQQIGSNFHYIGSSMQHRWDDVGFQKSFIVVDTADFSISRIHVNAPEFIVVDDSLSSDVKNCFVRVVTDSELRDESKDSFLSRLKDMGALSVEFKHAPQNLDSCEQRIDLSEDRGMFGIIEDYVNSDFISTDTFDIKKLIGIGKDILSEVDN